jgi:hypothetical protein
MKEEKMEGFENLNNLDYSGMNNLTSGQAAALGAAGAGIGIMMVLVALLVAAAVYVIMALSLMKIAQKTGFEKKAWWAWVPILNMILMYNLGGYSGWWMICPIGNFVVMIMSWMKISVKCGKPDWLGILMIVSPLNLIIPIYLAFSSPDKK